ncbi:MAG TPA: DinB family protein [Candidatus Limnocylindrales bacterium]|nr:DinB family protein [Candidatus Limnocylindrales bacterium]
MTSAERERAVALLEETRERLLGTTRGLSPTQWQYKPALDQWSVAELVEHIAYVEGLTLIGIDRALQKEPVSIQPSEEDDAFVKRITGRVQRLTAPERVVPSGRWALEELIPQFEAARKRSLEFAKTTEAPLRRHGFPHPFFGPLDCYQWLLLIPSHCERHRRQAEEVMGAAGFPRAAAVS